MASCGTTSPGSGAPPPSSRRPSRRSTARSEASSLWPRALPLGGGARWRGRSRPVPAAPLASSPGPHATNDDVARGLARFGLLVERLEKSLPKEGPRRLPDALTAQLLATAATASRSSRELEENLARLSRIGVDVPSGDALFRKLSESLPGWGVPVNPDADETIGPGARGSVVGAMRRLVTLAPDAEEGAKRFREMVQSGVEQFNGGNLGRAVTLFSLAEQVIRRERVEKAVAQAMRARSHEALDPARMRLFAEKPENHFGLKTVLDFFPAYRPDGLLESLREERKREGRRLLLSLLEVHGPSARDAALEKLSVAASAPAAETDWYFLRNLLYVLRKVPRTSEAPSETEIDFLFRLSEPSQPLPLVKEALANLGQTRHERAEQILVARLSQLESAAAKAGAVVPADLLQLLDKTCAALCTAGDARGPAGHRRPRAAGFGCAFRLRRPARSSRRTRPLAPGGARRPAPQGAPRRAPGEGPRHRPRLQLRRGGAAPRQGPLGDPRAPRAAALRGHLPQVPGQGVRPRGEKGPLLLRAAAESPRRRPDPPASRETSRSSVSRRSSRRSSRRWRPAFSRSRTGGARRSAASRSREGR